jgi:hypothetical protein
VDRFVNQDGADFQQGVVGVDLEFTAGTSGAVPASLGRAHGIASVVKSSNDYIVTFEDSYVAFMGGFGGVKQASFSTSGACSVDASADAVTGATPTVTLSPRTGAGAAVALATGDVLRFHFRMKRSRGDV